MSSLVASLDGMERDTGFDLSRIQELENYWSDVRSSYQRFDEGLSHPMTEIYRFEIPGGQYTNLKPQVESIGLGDRFEEVKEMYKTVNDMLGDLIKVTPSSKMVGDMAIFMVQNNLTPENIVEKGAYLTFPDSVVSYFKGMMGQPAWGFPKDLQHIVLKGEKPIECRPGELLEPVDFESGKETLKKIIPSPTDRDVISYYIYPKVVTDYLEHYKEYGAIAGLTSHVFFGGLDVGETTRIDIQDGKTLVIKFVGLGDTDEEGNRTVQFELNGMRRDVTVPDPNVAQVAAKVVMADPDDKSQVGATIPGVVSKVCVAVGDAVEENQTIAVVEAMKMEINNAAKIAGTVESVFVSAGQTVKAGELLSVIKVS